MASHFFGCKLINAPLFQQFSNSGTGIMCTWDLSGCVDGMKRNIWCCSSGEILPNQGQMNLLFGPGAIIFWAPNDHHSPPSAEVPIHPIVIIDSLSPSWQVSSLSSHLGNTPGQFFRLTRPGSATWMGTKSEWSPGHKNCIYRIIRQNWINTLKTFCDFAPTIRFETAPGAQLQLKQKSFLHHIWTQGS